MHAHKESAAAIYVHSYEYLDSQHANALAMHSARAAEGYAVHPIVPLYYTTLLASIKGGGQGIPPPCYSYRRLCISVMLRTAEECCAYLPTSTMLQRTRTTFCSAPSVCTGTEDVMLTL